MESDNFYKLKAVILTAAKQGKTDQVKYLCHSYPDLANCLDEGTGYSPILHAAQQGHLEMVKFLLQKQVYVNRPSLQDEYPIFEAIKNGHEETAACLIKYGLDFTIRDKEGFTILMYAAVFGMESLVRLILSEQPIHLHAVCKKGQNAAVKAYFAGYLDIVDVLVNAGLILGVTSVYKRNQEILTYNLNKILNQKNLDKQKSLDLGLRFAVRNQMRSLIGLLIRMGANPNCTYDDHQKPLFLCAQHGNLESFEELYFHKARLDAKNVGGKTALHLAVFFQNIPMLEKLMELEKEKFSIFNMKVISPKDTLNPLFLAIIYGRAKVLEHFLTKIPSHFLDKINARQPLLHYAIYSVSYISVETLLKYNIDVNQKNAQGETPLITLTKLKMDLIELANESKLIEVATLLIQKGANLEAESGGKCALDFARETNKGSLATILNEEMSSRLAKKAPLIFSAVTQECTLPKPSHDLGGRGARPNLEYVKFR